MFSGIVEEIGVVRELARGPGDVARISIDCEQVLVDTRVGDSINVNGCCLTVTNLRGTGFLADLMGETLERTALGDLAAAEPVNLERALRADARLGGHLVQGHVDGVGEVTTIADQGEWTRMAIAAPAALRRYLAPKGAIAVDGVSLTVISTDDAGFSVGLIPHTLTVTTLGRTRASGRVNLEVDVVAKYVERLLRAGAPSPYAGSEDQQ